jgi:hypothetical protein
MSEKHDIFVVGQVPYDPFRYLSDLLLLHAGTLKSSQGSEKVVRVDKISHEDPVHETVPEPSGHLGGDLLAPARVKTGNGDD